MFDFDTGEVLVVSDLVGEWCCRELYVSSESPVDILVDIQPQAITGTDVLQRAGDGIGRPGLNIGTKAKSPLNLNPFTASALVAGFSSPLVSGFARTAWLAEALLDGSVSFRLVGLTGTIVAEVDWMPGVPANLGSSPLLVLQFLNQRLVVQYLSPQLLDSLLLFQEKGFQLFDFDLTRLRSFLVRARSGSGF
jgi:hypothetical protein